MPATVFLFSVSEFIGRFHPVLVHLPVGILLIAALFQWLSLKEKFASLQQAARIALFWGMLSAIASCISGYLLSTTDGYDEDLIFKHQWFGISVAVISVMAYFFQQKNKSAKWLTVVMVLLVVITGHLGGSITHGSDYLTKTFTEESSTAVTVRKPLPNVQEAVAYSDVVKPILEAKCYSCHGQSKQKGKLRLDQPDFIMKGGKDGVVIAAAKPEESELVKRILFGKDNKEHMPPAEKPQLTKQETELLHWWIAGGADFNKKVKDLAQTDKVKPALTALQSAPKKEVLMPADIPVKPVDKADASVIEKLQARGIAIIPVDQTSNYLSANFVAVDAVTAADLQLLQSISKQLVWVKLSKSTINDVQLEAVAKLTALTRLFLDRTNITDKGLAQLSRLEGLHYLNLVGTKVTAAGLAQLKNLKGLLQLYLYQTPSVADFKSVRLTFPKTIIDTGGYTVPLLPGDTSELTKAVAK